MSADCQLFPTYNNNAAAAYIMNAGIDRPYSPSFPPPPPPLHYNREFRPNVYGTQGSLVGNQQFVYPNGGQQLNYSPPSSCLSYHCYRSGLKSSDEPVDEVSSASSSCAKKNYLFCSADQPAAAPMMMGAYSYQQPKYNVCPAYFCKIAKSTGCDAFECFIMEWSIIVTFITQFLSYTILRATSLLDLLQTSA